jgi:hypothetical protein
LGWGIWAVDTVAGQAASLHPWFGACDVTRDRKAVAVFGQSPEEKSEGFAAPRAPNEPPRRIEAPVRVGPPGGPMRTIWGGDDLTGDSLMLIDGAATVSWSFTGRRLLVQDGRVLLVLDAGGESWAFGERVAAASRGGGVAPNAHRKRWAAGSASPLIRTARWAGRSDDLVALQCKDDVLRLLNVATGAMSVLCPCPPGFVGGFDVAADLSAAAFFSCPGPAPRPGDHWGVWVWRRGDRGPARLTEAGPRDWPALATQMNVGAISPDGRYVAVGDPAPARLYEMPAGKVVWTAADPPTFGSFAFDAESKQLAMVSQGPGGLFVMSLADMKPRPLPYPEARILQLKWAADAATLLMGTTGLGKPGPIFIRNVGGP